MTGKQLRFCEEYIVDNNATQAAIRAGYKENTAKEMGYENLTKPHISEKIAELKKYRTDEINYTVDKWLKEQIAIAHANPLDAMESTGTGFVFKDINEFPESLKKAIKKISFRRGVGMEVEFYNKQASLDALAKFIGAYEKDNEQGSKTTYKVTIVE